MQIARVSRWDDPRRGTGVHVNVVHGGTRTNVIAAEARAQVDLRASRVSEMRRIERQFRALRPIFPGARTGNSRRLLAAAARTENERRAFSPRAKAGAGAVHWKLEEICGGRRLRRKLHGRNWRADARWPGCRGRRARTARNEHIMIRELGAARRTARRFDRYALAQPVSEPRPSVVQVSPPQIRSRFALEREVIFAQHFADGLFCGAFHRQSVEDAGSGRVTPPRSMIVSTTASDHA